VDLRRLLATQEAYLEDATNSAHTRVTSANL